MPVASRVSGRSTNIAFFLLLCTIWGTTWIGIKAGLASVPPLMLAGTRFTAAGLLMTGWAVARHGFRIRQDDVVRLLAASVLLIAICYGLLFWGMTRINSGTAAVLELGLTPVALMAFGLLLKEEQPSLRKSVALGGGAAGLIVLFGPSAADAWSGRTGAGTQVFGAAAVASAAIAYSLCSVVARPLLRAYPTVLIAGASTLIGGLLLVLASVACEGHAALHALRGDWGAAAWAGWLFLVIGGSLVGSLIYMRLLRDIGPVRAGLYAFVSPVIAVALGAALRGEHVTSGSIAGMVILLAAAGLALGDEHADDGMAESRTPPHAKARA